MKGLLDYSLLLSVEKSEEAYNREKIIEKRKAAANLMGRQSQYVKGVKAQESRSSMLDRRLSGATKVGKNNLSFHQDLKKIESR